MHVLADHAATAPMASLFVGVLCVAVVVAVVALLVRKMFK
jgi:hypothetical protein